jgi:hypothetical protein
MRAVAYTGLILTPFAAIAAPSPQVPPSAGGTAQGDLSVTIYSNDLALVQDVRHLDLPAGRTRQAFADVSAAIRPETVGLVAPDATVIEQNFDYDLLSPTSLMQKAIGETITLLRTNPGTGVETRERAKVLAVNGGVVLDVDGKIEVLRDDGLTDVRRCRPNDACSRWRSSCPAALFASALQGVVLVSLGTPLAWLSRKRFATTSRAATVRNSFILPTPHIRHHDWSRSYEALVMRI